MDSLVYIRRTVLSEQILNMMINGYTEGGYRKWDKQQEVEDKLQALVDEYMPEFKRNKEELAKYERYINSW